MKGLKNNWQIINLESVADIYSGNPAPPKKDLSEKGIGFVRVSDLAENKDSIFIFKTKNSITNEKASDIKLRMFPKGAILFPKSGASLKLNHRSILGIDAFVVSHIAVLVPKENITSEWLYYYLQTVNMSTYCHSADFPSLPLSIIKKIPIIVPPLEDQKKILSILEKANELIQKRLQTIKLTKQLIQVVFIKNFGDPHVNPMDWTKLPLSDLVTKVQYGTSSKLDESRGIPCLRMNNITEEGVVDISDLKYLNENEDSKKFLLKKDDILFNRTNSRELVGKTAIFDLDINFVYAGYLIRIVVNREKCNPYFLNVFMNLPDTKRKIRSMAKGSVGQANINAQEIQKLCIINPPIDLQNKFEIILKKLIMILHKKQESISYFNKLFSIIQSNTFKQIDIASIQNTFHKSNHH